MKPIFPTFFDDFVYNVVIPFYDNGYTVILMAQIFFAIMLI